MKPAPESESCGFQQGDRTAGPGHRKTCDQRRYGWIAICCCCFLSGTVCCRTRELPGRKTSKKSRTGKRCRPRRRRFSGARAADSGEEASEEDLSGALADSASESDARSPEVRGSLAQGNVNRKVKAQNPDRGVAVAPPPVGPAKSCRLKIGNIEKPRNRRKA